MEFYDKAITKDNVLHDMERACMKNPYARVIAGTMLVLLISATSLMPPTVLVSQKDERTRIEVVKHIVKDSGITEEDLTNWLKRANEVWGCSLQFVQVATHSQERYDSSKNVAGKINLWAVPQASSEPKHISEAKNDEVQLTPGDGKDIRIKDSTLSHELGHIFGVKHNSTYPTDPNNIMYPDNRGDPPKSCNRKGTNVTDDQQKTVREGAKRFQAKDAGRGRDVYDAVVTPIGAYMDITWAEGWTEHAAATWTLHFTLNIVSFSNVSYWLGFLIESDSNVATGKPAEGIDYIVSFNPAKNLVNFSRYDSGWKTLDSKKITREFTYCWKDSDTLPIINGISFSLPITSLDRRAGNSVSVRAVAYNETHTDQAPDTGFLIISSQPSAWSTDSPGNPKSIFNMTDNIYVRGRNFSANTSVAIYLIPNGAAALTSNAVTSAFTTTNSTGGLPVTLVWSQPLALGKYDIWIDVNQNGVFDWGDLWNSQSVDVYGLEVIPEFPKSASIPLMLVMLLTAVIAIYKRRLLKP